MATSIDWSKWYTQGTPDHAYKITSEDMEDINTDISTAEDFFRRINCYPTSGTLSSAEAIKKSVEYLRSLNPTIMPTASVSYLRVGLYVIIPSSTYSGSDVDEYGRPKIDVYNNTGDADDPNNGKQMHIHATNIGDTIMSICEAWGMSGTSFIQLNATAPLQAPHQLEVGRRYVAWNRDAGFPVRPAIMQINYDPLDTTKLNIFWDFRLNEYYIEREISGYALVFCYQTLESSSQIRVPVDLGGLTFVNGDDNTVPIKHATFDIGGLKNHLNTQIPPKHLSKLFVKVAAVPKTYTSGADEEIPQEYVNVVTDPVTGEKEYTKIVYNMGGSNFHKSAEWEMGIFWHSDWSYGDFREGSDSPSDFHNVWCTFDLSNNEVPGKPPTPEVGINERMENGEFVRELVLMMPNLSSYFGDNLTLGHEIRNEYAIDFNVYKVKGNSTELVPTTYRYYYNTSETPGNVVYKIDISNDYDVGYRASAVLVSTNGQKSLESDISTTVVKAPPKNVDNFSASLAENYIKRLYVTWSFDNTDDYDDISEYNIIYGTNKDGVENLIDGMYESVTIDKKLTSWMSNMLEAGVYYVHFYTVRDGMRSLTPKYIIKPNTQSEIQPVSIGIRPAKPVLRVLNDNKTIDEDDGTKTIYWVYQSLDGSIQRKAELLLMFNDDDEHGFIHINVDILPESWEMQSQYTLDIEALYLSKYGIPMVAGDYVDVFAITYGALETGSPVSNSIRIVKVGTPEISISKRETTDPEDEYNMPWIFDYECNDAGRVMTGLRVKVIYNSTDPHISIWKGNRVTFAYGSVIYDKYYTKSEILGYIRFLAGDMLLKYDTQYKIQISAYYDDIVVNDFATATTTSETDDPILTYSYNRISNIPPLNSIQMNATSRTESIDSYTHLCYIYRNDVNKCVSLADGIANPILNELYFVDASAPTGDISYTLMTISRKTGCESRNGVYFTETMPKINGIFIRWPYNSDMVIRGEEPDISSYNYVHLIYDLDIEESYDNNTQYVDYIGNTLPVAYFNSKENGNVSIKCNVISEDSETMKHLDKLKKYKGVVLIQDEDGESYTGVAEVSYNRNKRNKITSVSVNITRTDGDFL